MYDACVQKALLHPVNPFSGLPAVVLHHAGTSYCVDYCSADDHRHDLH